MEAKRLKLKEIDKIDLSEISPIIEKKISSSLEPKLEDIIAKNGDIMEIKLGYNNSYDRKSNGLTPDARKRFIDSDKLYFQKTSTNITIHISKRDVVKQAELFIKHEYHGEGYAVLWPGCSLHNWGLAFDLALTNNDVLPKSLKENGWKQTIKKNAWHFECTGSRDYEKAVKVIKSFRTPKTGLAFKWSNQVASYYQKTATLNKRASLFNNKLQANKTNSQKLLSEIEAFNTDAQGLKSRTNNFNKDVAKYNIELGKAKRLLEEISNMYDSVQKNKKISEYDRITDWLDAESIRINKEDKSIENENRDILSWNAKLHRKVADNRREDNWLTIENRVLNKLVYEIEQHKNNASMHLKSIESQTWK